MTFCLLCLVPTFLVCGAAVVVNTPIYKIARTDRWSAELAAQLGMEVEWGLVELAGDERYIVRDLELRDPESHAWLARVRSAIVQWQDGEWIIKLGQPELHAKRLPRLAEIVHEHVLRRGDSHRPPVQLIAPTVTIHGEPRAETLLEARCAWDMSHELTELFLQFQLADTDAAELVRFRVVRNRQLDPPATGWELHTAGAALPCQLARAWLPQVKHLGMSCTYEGSVWTKCLGSGQDMELTGVFRQLDLDTLVTQRFPHKLTGTAELTVSRLIVHEGRIHESSGRLVAPGGVVSRTLLGAAEQHLKLGSYVPSNDAMLLRYEDLWLDFVVDEHGLVLGGRDDLSRTILSDSQGPLLTSQDAVPVPPQALVQVLVPLSDVQVPVTSESTVLLNALPLPTGVPQTSTAARRHVDPLRLLRRE
jgi:hypothetical protein